MQRLVARLAVRFGSGSGGDGGPSAAEEAHAGPVREVLNSRCWHEVIGLALLPVPSAARVAHTQEPARDDSMLEAGVRLTREAAPAEEDLPEASDSDVVEAYLCTAVKVHPFCNEHEDADHATRWVADAFTNLRTRPLRDASLDEERRALRDEVAVGEQRCETDSAQALHLFSEVVMSVIDRLSVHDLGRGGVSRATTDALLHGLYILHARPLQNGSNSQAAHLFSSVLAGTLAANSVAAAATRVLMPSGRRSNARLFCSTIIAAVGGIAFTSASRIQHMLAPDRAQRLGVQDNLTPLVSCPLCRVASAASQAIRNVHAGESVPVCCVCTEERSDVCLPCGHVCVCDACFGRLPRTTAV